MMAWARALAHAGRVDEARYLADRLREFRNAGSDEFFGECRPGAASAPPFQCQPAQQPHRWQDFLKP
jgi:hypothetical protein